MTYAQLKTAIITLADDPALSDPQAGIWLNANYQTLMRERDWPFLVTSSSYTVTTGVAETLFSTFSPSVGDFAKPLRAWISSSSTSEKQPLTPINYEDRNQPGLTNCYYITPDNLSFGLVSTPTNSTDTVTLDYLKSARDLDGATYDQPIFLSDFHWILVWKALMNYQFQQREASDEFRQQYADILDKMVRFYFTPEAGSTVRLSRGTGRIVRTGTSNPLYLS